MAGRAADVRIGTGHDIHRLEPGRRLVLGGVEIPAERGFATPSDGDVVCHALIDAHVTLGTTRLAPHLDGMRENVAAALAMPAARVSIKARTNDGLGPDGEGRAASATVVVLLAPTSAPRA